MKKLIAILAAAMFLGAATASFADVTITANADVTGDQYAVVGGTYFSINPTTIDFMVAPGGSIFVAPIHTGISSVPIAAVGTLTSQESEASASLTVPSGFEAMGVQPLEGVALAQQTLSMGGEITQTVTSMNSVGSRGFQTATRNYEANQTVITAVGTHGQLANLFDNDND